MDAFYKNETSRILQSIGSEEVSRLFKDPESELDSSFVGFLHVYVDLESISKDFTIIDFGCNAAFQGHYFKNHKCYIGIDNSQPIEWRLRQDNAKYYLESGQEFISNILPNLIEEGLDLNKTIAICSYVPDKELQNMIAEVFPYHKVVYCDNIISENYPK